MKNSFNQDKYAKLYNEGFDHFVKKDFINAIKIWEEALSINNNADLNSVLSRVYLVSNNIELSCKYIEKAITLKPYNFEYLHRYSLILFEKGDLKKSINILKKSLDLDPKNKNVLNDIAVIYFKMKEFNNAIDYFKQALEIDEDFIDSAENLIKSYIEIKEIDKAKSLLAKYLIKDSSNNKLKKIDIYFKSLENREEFDSNKNDDHIELQFSNDKFKIDRLKIFEDFAGDQDQEKDKIELSIVIPIMNEEGNIKILHKNLTEVLVNLKQEYEIIFIDDGSRDNSLKILKEVVGLDSHTKVIEFRKNYGQTAAMSAGFKYAHGSVIITMDGDLQNDPADIPNLLEKMSEGYDLVSGWRKDRQDKSLTRVIPSKIANSIINKLIQGTGIQLNDYGCTLKAYKRGIIKNINLYGEMHRFIPVFAAWLGVKVAEIPVKHHPRVHGNAKYNLSRVSRVIFDLLVVRFFSDFSTTSIQFFGKIAKKMLYYGGIFLLLLTAIIFFFPQISFTYDTILILTGMLLFASFQLLIMGLLGEIMMRVYFEGQKKDYFIVENIIQK